LELTLTPVVPDSKDWFGAAAPKSDRAVTVEYNRRLSASSRRSEVARENRGSQTATGRQVHDGSVAIELKLPHLSRKSAVAAECNVGGLVAPFEQVGCGAAVPPPPPPHAVRKIAVTNTVNTVITFMPTIVDATLIAAQ
jgi:hypothetical protein